MQKAIHAGRQEALIHRVLHVRHVEKLSPRQIAEALLMWRKRVRR